MPTNKNGKAKIQLPIAAKQSVQLPSPPAPQAPPAPSVIPPAAPNSSQPAVIPQQPDPWHERFLGGIQNHPFAFLFFVFLVIYLWRFTNHENVLGQFSAPAPACCYPNNGAASAENQQYAGDPGGQKMIYITNRCLNCVVHYTKVHSGVNHFDRQVLWPKTVTPFCYEGHAGVGLYADVYDESGIKLYSTRLEDFHGGIYTWFFDRSGATKEVGN